MKQLKRNLLSTAVLPAVVGAGAVLAAGFATVPCGRATANGTYTSSGQANPEAVPMPSDMRGMNAGCCAAECNACGAACAACNPCAVIDSCNPCAASDLCNPCGIDPCAACNACCGAALETGTCNPEAVPA